MTTVKLTDPDTPSEAIIKAAKKVAEVTDAQGRLLRVRKLNALNRQDLAMVLGKEGCENPIVFNQSALAFSVVAIDGEPVMPPNTYAEMRALVGRLDDDGLIAAGQAAVDHFGAAADDPALASAALKND